MSAAIRVEGLTKRFGETAAVRGVSFEVARGELVGFLGPNGAGKSTTMRMLAGYLRPDAGAAFIDGHNVCVASGPARAALGYLPEHNPLYPEMRVESYLSFRARLCGLPASRRRTAVGSALERCSIRDVRRRRIGALSKGYRQRVGLAAALVHDPPALILDEPTSALDPSQVIETRRLLRELARERAILLSTHVLSEVERACDRVIVIARGRVRAIGPPGALGEGAAGSGPRRVIVEVEAAGAEAARAALGQVEALPASSGWSRFAVALPGEADPLAAAARRCAARGVLVRELTWEDAGSLERAFARLIESAEAEDSTGAAQREADAA